MREQLLLRIKEQNRRMRVRRRILMAFMYFILVFVLLSVAYRFLFVVKHVNISGESRYEPEKVSEYLSLEGENLISLKPGEISKNALFAFPYLSSCKVSRKLPNTVEIELADDGGSFFLSYLNNTFVLSSDMRVLGFAETESDIEGKIEIVTNKVERCLAGYEADIGRLDTNDIIRSLYKAISDKGLNDKISKIDVTDHQNTVLVYEHRFLVSLGSGEDFSYKLAFLEKISDEFPNGERAEVYLSDVKMASVKLTNVDGY